MSEQAKQGVPQVTVSTWPTCAMPEAEIRASLMYLAHKTGKSVRFMRYPGEMRYSTRFVNVYVCAGGDCGSATRIQSLRLNKEELPLSENQPGSSFDSPEEDKEDYVQDEDGTIVAIVHRNCILIRIEITGEDNQAARTILAYVVEKAVAILDFEVDTQVGSRQEEAEKQFKDFFAKSLSSRLDQKRNDAIRAERDAETHYYSLIEAERQKIATAEELAGLERLQKKIPSEITSKQAKALVEMEEDGMYEEITFHPSGSVNATTGEIVIEYTGWTFPMGQYEVSIDSQGKVTIQGLRDHPETDYPHPHVSDRGSPCLGNIHADVGKMIGQFRIAEALQVLHKFLCSYEPSGAYVKIGKFDETGEFDDPDEDPCQDCDDKYSPYCIHSCDHNDGWFTCSDCNDYRTEYCYEECSYNQDLSPCDDCQHSAGEETCFGECENNQSWRWQNPCETYCQRKECVEYECKWFKRKLELEGKGRQFDPGKAPEFVRDHTLDEPEDEPNPDWTGGDEAQEDAGDRREERAGKKGRQRVQVDSSG